MKEKFEAFKEFYMELFNFEQLEDEVIMLDEENGKIDSYPFMIVLPKDEDPGFISFNEDLPTSTLINIALNVVPYLEEAWEVAFVVDNCHYPKFNKKGELTKYVFEDSYEKTVKEIKEPKE